MITALSKKSTYAYCMGCHKHFRAKRWKDLSTAIKCPKCGFSKDVVSKGHPFFVENKLVEDSNETTEIQSTNM